MTATNPAAALLRTPLHASHLRANARMVDFAGWDMPVQYNPTGIIAEHQAVREACGIFDLSHMGRVFVRGRDAFALAQRCVTRDLARVGPGDAAYALLCREDGGILDDVIGYVVGPEELLFVFNASNRLRDVARFEEIAARDGLQATLDDQTLATALIGVQGPRAQVVLQPHCAAGLDPLPGYTFVQTRVLGQPALVARTGYTGEDGFEVMVDGAVAPELWDALAATAGVMLCGLGARDTLRTEAAMPLYGHEIDESTNPYEAGLGWAVSLAKEAFAGRDALAAVKAAGPARKLVALLVGAGGVPRPEFPVLHEGRPVGHLTSGTHSPTLKRGIALGYVPAALAAPGTQVAVESRGKPIPAEIVAPPFVPHRSRPRAAKRTLPPS